MGYLFVRMGGGPGTGDPTRIDYRNCSLTSIVGRAYKFSHWQITAQDWMGMASFDIAAKVPPGATEEQFRLMLQNLLAERFKLQVHRETKEMALYSLSVARNGPKLKPHVEAAPPAGAGESRPEENRRLKADSNGYPILSGGTSMAVMNDKARLQFDNTDMAALADQFSGTLGTPVIDDTRLEGKYDIALFWTTPLPSARVDADASPDLFAAVQEQLGLKLERKKGPVEILVIDRAQRVPTGN